MGISGLIPFVEKSSKKCHISEFRGCTVAVDSYCWLHKGAFSCSDKLAKGETTDGYVLYCLKYIKMLQDFNIKPIMVFDGQHLPAKAQTEKKRREQRQLAKKQAAECLRLGKIAEARNYFHQCVDISHSMALDLIKECRKMNIDCIVAPYEADAELAYLNINKIADAVITEDSDLLPFGCSKIIFKLNLQGCGVLVESDRLYLSMKMRPDMYTFDKFRYMCILSGCDYLPSLPGIGLKKALKFLCLTVETNIYKVLPKLPSYLNMRNLIVTNEYKHMFMVADASFKHQIVYDPIQRKLLPLTDPEISGTKKEYCCNAGAMFDEQKAFQLALGNIDPFTHEQMDDWNPDKRKMNENLNNSIWSKFYTKPEQQKLTKTELKTTKNKMIELNTKKIQDIKIVEKEKDDYSKKLEEELKVYIKPSCSKGNDTNNEIIIESDDDDDDDEEKEEKKSPVLNRNPFIKKSFKKMSKFKPTVIDETVVVRSKYFNKNSDTTNNSNLTFLNDIDNYSRQQKIKKTELLSTTSIDDESHSKNENYIKTDLDNINYDSTPESKCDESDIENLTPPDNPSNTNFTKQNTTNNESSKNKNKNLYRSTQSQKKKSSVSKNQPTLLSMFSNMKK